MVVREIGAFDKDDIQKLVELGFPLSYHEANRKGVNVVTRGVNKFKIDKVDLSWPQETRGIALGETLNCIRAGRGSQSTDCKS